MKPSLSQQLHTLEEELLEMEYDLSHGESVDISLFIAKTKEYTALKVEHTRETALEEGLQAGLVVTQIKQDREETQTPAAPSETVQAQTHILEEKRQQLQELQDAKNARQQALEQPQAFQETNTQTPQRYTRIDKNPFQFQPPPFQQPPSIATGVEFITSKFQDSSNSQGERPPKPSPIDALSELNLGKYVMGILAAILALTGTLLLGSLLYPTLDNPTKALLQSMVGGAMVFFPYRHIATQRGGESNGFLTSLMGTGLSILYLTVVFMGTSWQMLTQLSLLSLLIALICATVFLARHIQSNTLLAVSYLGNLATFFLLATITLSTSYLQISISALLATTVFLVGYTLKSSWTGLVSKVASVATGLLALYFSVGNINQTWKNNAYSLGLRPYETTYYADPLSPLFPIFCIAVVFALFMALIVGRGLSVPRKDQCDDITSFHTLCPVGLFCIYFYFFQIFEGQALVCGLILLATYLLHQNKAQAFALSVPYTLFVIFSLADLLPRPSNDQFIYLCLLGLSTGLFLLFKRTAEKSYYFSIIPYTVMAWLYFIIELEDFYSFTPLALFLAYQVYDGFQDSEHSDDENPLLTVLKLCCYIPFLFALSVTLYQYNITPCVGTVFYSLTLLATCAITTGVRVTALWDFTNPFLVTTYVVQQFVFAFLSAELVDHSDARLLGSCAILAFMLDNLFPLLDEDTHLLLKIKSIFSLLLPTLVLQQLTFLASVEVASSLIILCFGIFSIFWGFRQQEGTLRQLGLALSILSVVKMVLIDMGDSDPITRVFGMIVGAILCFGISCVYNKLE